jgi:histidinol-phosphate aminotransferase
MAFFTAPSPSAYEPPPRPATVDLLLDGNEGTLPPRSLLAELEPLLPDLLRRYPDTRALRDALARRWSLPADQVLVTAGADDALERCCRATLGPGASALFAVPTFEMIERYVERTGAVALRVDWPGGAWPLDELEATSRPDTRLALVVSPNNPTGAVAGADRIERLADALPDALVVVDHAYVEYADEDPTARLLARPNLVVLRTLSKAWGLAGLRVGYALGPPRAIAALRACGQPYAVAGVSAALAAAWLARGEETVAAHAATVRRERGRLAARLATLGAPAEPSQANFVLVRTPRAAWLRDGLAGLGIGVRTWRGRPDLGDAVRISCPGDPDELTRLERALDAVLAPEAVLFDLDGVLADVSRSYRRAIVETAGRFGVRLDAADVAAAKAAGGANNDWRVCHRLVRERGGTATLEEVTRVFEDFYQGGLWRDERPLTDAAALRRLAAGRPIGIVTGRPRRDAERFLAHFDLGGAVDALVAMEDAPAKPDPAPVALALERLGAASGVLVGDTPDDVRAARAAGVVPVGIAAPGDERAPAAAALAEAGAARVLDRLDELAEVLS